MMAIGDFKLRDPARSERGRRPYWLLLALLLFCAGQLLSIEHRHDSAQSIHGDCALCLFSSASSGALPVNAWAPHAIAIAAPEFLFAFAAPRRTAARFHDSRAPPFHS